MNHAPELGDCVGYDNAIAVVDSTPYRDDARRLVVVVICDGKQRPVRVEDLRHAIECRSCDGLGHLGCRACGGTGCDNPAEPNGRTCWLCGGGGVVKCGCDDGWEIADAAYVDDADIDPQIVLFDALEAIADGDRNTAAEMLAKLVEYLGCGGDLPQSHERQSPAGGVWQRSIVVLRDSHAPANSD